MIDAFENYIPGLRACPNVNALGVKFWRKLQMQLYAYPVIFLMPNCCKRHQRFILWQSLDFTEFVRSHLVTGVNLEQSM